MAKIRPLLKKLNIKVEIIETKTLPAVILLKSLTPSEMALEQYDANSIKTNSGTKGKGHPSGRNVLKKLNLWIEIDKIVNPKKTIKLNPKVNIKEVVSVKE